MRSTTKLKLAILLCAGTQTSHLALTSSIAKIGVAFPEASTTSIQIVSSIPSLTVVPFALIAGWVSTFMSKKTIVLISLLFMIIGGLLPVFIHGSITALMFFSAIVGVGIGLSSPTITGIIADNFSGQERTKLFGYQSAAMCLGGMIIIFTGGVLANIAWYYVFLAFSFIIPIFIIGYIMLPNQKPQKEDKAMHSGSPSRIRFNTKIAELAAIALFFGLLFNTFGTNAAIYISEAGINDSALAGSLNSVLLIGGFIGGVAFKRISQTLGSYTLPAVFILIGSALLLLFCKSIPVMFIISMTTGASINIFVPQGKKIISSIVKPSMITLGAGIFTSAQHIGLFLSPIVITAVSGAFLGDSARVRFGLTGTLALIFAVVLILVTLINHIKSKDNSII